VGPVADPEQSTSRTASWPALKPLAPVVVAVGWFLRQMGSSLAVFLVIDVLLGIRARGSSAPVTDP
jgi:hypothetical protein